MTNQVLRIGYKDQATDIIDAVNKLIAPYGLKFVDDDLDHDGWIEYVFAVDDAALPIQSPPG